ncbi:hypothetical protein J8273_2523 [Carpediemonas membranifera]|uniref:Uncharacterized protein n=1 Tax=Carpediemonas membranifera TaxID=201153 RepID=A0A8J6C037_9EUKA|nr:hypothetical protein J8273_2513 [Carpediemonas membranifera]KAG9396171.1 hypothetical protein J8273_2523 [Carpediemonas membranifera]|eukprot:KAG9396161.1 hypothetical protein J8273_2513 [Carpediemonas membranifera]
MPNWTKPSVFIRKMGITKRCMSTTIVLAQKYYFQAAPTLDAMAGGPIPTDLLCAACLCIAVKIASDFGPDSFEPPVHEYLVLKHVCRHGSAPTADQLDIRNSKARFATTECSVLATIGFENLAPSLPHGKLLEILPQGIAGSVVELAWAILNDSCSLPESIERDPAAMAEAALKKAVSMAGHTASAHAHV